MINANLINTGALRIAENSPANTDQPWLDAKFYADADRGTNVYIGGWEVGTTSLKTQGLTLCGNSSKDTLPSIFSPKESSVQIKTSNTTTSEGTEIITSPTGGPKRYEIYVAKEYMFTKLEPTEGNYDLLFTWE
jgi:hypothetical protein